MMNSETKRSLGRRAHEPTIAFCKIVEAMASQGISQEEIADVLEIDAKTLRKHYARLLKISATRANAAVGQTLLMKATAKAITGPSVAAAIFWLKTRARWRERDDLHIELTGRNGGPVETRHMTVEQAADAYAQLIKGEG